MARFLVRTWMQIITRFKRRRSENAATFRSVCTVWSNERFPRDHSKRLPSSRRRIPSASVTAIFIGQTSLVAVTGSVRRYEFQRSTWLDSTCQRCALSHGPSPLAGLLKFLSRSFLNDTRKRSGRSRGQSPYIVQTSNYYELSSMMFSASSRYETASMRIEHYRRRY